MSHFQPTGQHPVPRVPQGPAQTLEPLRVVHLPLEQSALPPHAAKGSPGLGLGLLCQSSQPLTWSHSRLSLVVTPPGHCRPPCVQHALYAQASVPNKFMHLPVVGQSPSTLHAPPGSPAAGLILACVSVQIGGSKGPVCALQPEPPTSAMTSACATSSVCASSASTKVSAGSPRSWAPPSATLPASPLSASVSTASVASLSVSAPMSVWPASTVDCVVSPWFGPPSVAVTAGWQV